MCGGSLPSLLEKKNRYGPSVAIVGTARSCHNVERPASNWPIDTYPLRLWVAALQHSSAHSGRLRGVREPVGRGRYAYAEGGCAASSSPHFRRQRFSVADGLDSSNLTAVSGPLHAALRQACSGATNGFHTKLHGQGLRAEAVVARRLPRIPLDGDVRSATAVTPRRWCSAQGLQPRTEAGPRQLQLGVRRLCGIRFGLIRSETFASWCDAV